MGILICFLIMLGAAFLVTGILKAQLKTVEKKTRADRYAGPDALTLHTREDLYSHTSESRRYLPVNKEKK